VLFVPVIAFSVNLTVLPTPSCERIAMVGGLFREHRELIVVLVLFFILGCLYAAATPVFETPDEIQHYFHVKHIADSQGLPVLKREGEAIYGQEGGQPSLYYLAGALATFWIDTGDAEDLLNYNPYVNLGVPARDGNKNVILHTDQEGFPYAGTTLAIHVLRCVSLVFGALTVLATYFMAWEIFSGRKVIALGAAVVTAFNPQFLFTNAAVNNDGLLTALCSVALLMCVFVVTRGPSVRRYVLLGLAVGLAAVTKLTGVGLLAPVLVVLLMIGLRYSVREVVKGAAIIVGLVLLLAGWWYARNWLLYGDFTGMGMFFGALGDSPGRDLTLSRFVDELEGFRLSYWAVFGWFNVLAGRWVYRFFDVLVLAGLVGLPVALVRGLKRRGTVSFSALLLMVVWILVVGAGYVGYNRLIDAATGRLVFPAISSVSAFLVWGLVQLPPQAQRMNFVRVLGAAMVVVAVACPVLYIAPAYARPPILTSEEYQTISNRTDVTYGGRMKLLGYEVESEEVKPDESIYVTLYWEGLEAMERDYSVSLVVLTPGGELIGQEDSYPGLGSYPTSAWHPGEVAVDRAWVRIKRRTSAPTIGWLGVNVYYLPTMERLEASVEGETVEQVLLQPVKVAPWQVEQYEISFPLDVNLGNKIDLAGYDLDRSSVQPGDALTLTLYWRARKEMSEDYTVFTHLVDGEGRIWAQNDGYPRGGDYPTSFWGQGEVIRDVRELTVPADVPLGQYEMEVGLYLGSTGDRLPVLDDAGQVLDNRVVLDTVVVTD
jgi:hypothetical protein